MRRKIIRDSIVIVSFFSGNQLVCFFLVLRLNSDAAATGLHTGSSYYIIRFIFVLQPRAFSLYVHKTQDNNASLLYGALMGPICEPIYSIIS